MENMPDEQSIIVEGKYFKFTNQVFFSNLKLINTHTRTQRNTNAPRKKYVIGKNSIHFTFGVAIEMVFALFQIQSFNLRCFA